MNKLWYLALVLAMAGIAVQYPIVKNLNGSVDPFLLAFLRYAFASLTLTPVILYTRSLAVPHRSDTLRLGFIAVCAVTPAALIVLGVEYTNTLTASILINSNPLIVALLAPTLIHERMTSFKIIALGIGFIGVMFIVFNGHDPLTDLNSLYLWGSLLLLTGALLSAVNKIYSKDLVRKYDGLYVTFFSVVIGSVLLAILNAVGGQFDGLPDLTVNALLSIFAIGTVSTAIPWTIWASSLKHLDVHIAASFNLLVPVFAAIYSLLLLRESFTIWIFSGLILTSIGIYLVQRETVLATPST